MALQKDRAQASYPSRGGGDPDFLVARYWRGMFREQYSNVSNFITVNRVYLFPLTLIRRTITLDALDYYQEVTWAGNIIMGLYGPGTPNTDLPDGASLLGSSVAAAVGGSGFMEHAMAVAYQYVVAADLVIVPAWVAIIFSGAGLKLFDAYTPSNAAVTPRMYDAGAFVLIDPCPVTSESDQQTLVAARISSIP